MATQPRFEGPPGYGQDPLQKAVGGVRRNLNAPEAKGLGAALEYGPEVVEMVTTTIRDLRERCGGNDELFGKSLEQIAGLCQSITAELPPGWQYGDLRRRMEQELERIRNKAESEGQPNAGKES